MEKAVTEGNMKQLYDTTKKLSGRYSKPEIPIKDKEGRPTTEIQQQRNRWVEYFEELLNRPAVINPLDIETAQTDLPIDVNPPMTEEIRMAIRQIKSGKAAGPEDCQHYPELIRWTTVQGRAWKTADRCIPSKDRSQTKVSTLLLPLSTGGRLDYEYLDIRGKTRHTMDSSEPIRRFGLLKWPSPPISYTRTNTDQDSQYSSSLCISRPQHTQVKNQGPQIQHGEQQSNHT
ncbi:unnamed protein product [Schistosoma margrebowiei]|uniref:Uncharacterized protein n=1 Tax=Schistosoma margrebowiei TaxID=48269 RepID=A0A183LWR0_9TREM|nr:unnamed protein product [Schistosoma margrebowiei]